MKPAIVICSRVHSSRVPGKCFVRYNGTAQIEHLIKRLLAAEIPIYIAVPEDDVGHYMYLMDRYPKRVFISSGFPDDPLKRMHAVAKQNNIDTIVRVTHDKIFVDGELIKEFLENKNDYDYIYSSNFTPGTGFEVISFESLDKAVNKYKEKAIEHISYAVKTVTDKILNYKLSDPYPGLRLLIDYPEDVQLMDVLFSTLGENCTLENVTEFVSQNKWALNINRLPLVTIYTCAYNAEKWITEAMGSVAMQDGFNDYEYIIIDDYSTDKTLMHISKFCQTFKNAKFYKNIQNVGLASSSNRALKLSKGKYIIRLDADDMFTDKNSIKQMLAKIEDKHLDAVYPNYYVGVARKAVGKGNEHHHAGGTLFRTAALNHLKFTDALRGYDSLDLFLRARDQLHIGYLDAPTFVYRQTPNSMSRSNLKEREAIKKMLLSGVNA